MNRSENMSSKKGKEPSEIYYQKLVRNKIPEIILDQHEKPIFRILSEQEYQKELLHKLEEEVKEVVEATTSTEVLMECGDVLQVLEDILKHYHYTLDDLIDQKRKKEAQRGSFDDRFFLEKVVK